MLSIDQVSQWLREWPVRVGIIIVGFIAFVIWDMSPSTRSMIGLRLVYEAGAFLPAIGLGAVIGFLAYSLRWWAWTTIILVAATLWLRFDGTGKGLVMAGLAVALCLAAVCVRRIWRDIIPLFRQ